MGLFCAYILDSDGTPKEATPAEYLTWKNDFPDAYIVAGEQVRESKVYTVFLGLRHPNGALFETMVLGGWFDGWQCRYQTRAQAVAGHAEVLAVVKDVENEFTRIADTVYAASP